MKNRCAGIIGLMSVLFLLLGNCLGVVHGNVLPQGYGESIPSKEVDDATKVKVQESYGKLPLYFIQNDGQINEKVQYKVQYYEKGSGHAMFFTARGVYLSLMRGPQTEEKNYKSPEVRQQTTDSEPSTCNPQLIKLIPLGTNKDPEIIAEGTQEGKLNYFVGNDPEKWKTNIPTYQAVVYKDIYKDIDMKFYGNNRQLEYDIIVKPSANPSRVQLSYQGIEGLQVTEDGDLEISLKERKVIQKKPYVYQEIDGKKIEIDGKFKIYNAGSKKQVSERITRNSKPETRYSSPTTRHASRFVYGFHVASYNKHYPLIIDPTLDYSTFIGGSANDYGFDIAVDASGNAYVTGSTYSSDFPAVSAFDGSFAGGTSFSDAFVTKINASGSSLVYSTYLGGSNIDSGFGIAVDTSGNAYITGQTYSPNFPTANAMYGTNTGQFDAFVTKLASTGSSLIYSTYLGGGRTDGGNDIAVDTSGNVYVAGVATRDYSDRPNFPVSNPAYPHYGTYGGGTTTQDAFVTKINASGSNFVYSILIGGAGHDRADGIAIDTSGNAYITGQTGSSDFPMVSAIYGSLGGTYDAFVAKINNSGSIVYSTFLGGSGGDSGKKIAVDNSGNAYVTGLTDSSDFPTANAIYGTNTGQFNAFVTKLNATGNSLAYSTYILHGIAIEGAISIAVDTFENAYVLGHTLLPNPTIYGVNGKAGGVYVTKLNASGSNFVYSVSLGGSNFNYGYGIAVDNSGSVYITGNTTSSDFPTTSNAYDTSHNGNGSDAYAGMFGGDVFVAKIASDTTSPTASSTNPENGVTNVAVDSVITAVFSETMDASTITTDTFKVSDSSGNIGGTVTYSGTTATFTPSSNLAYSTTYTVTITTGVKDASDNTISSDYSWNFTTESAPNSAPVANAGTDQSVYVNDTVTLDGSGSTDADGNLLTYSWSFTSVPSDSNATLNNSTSVNPTFTVDKAGTYVVSLTVNDGTVNSAADTVTISTLNSAPVADAGTDQTPYVNNTVTLNGSGSYDVDGNLLTYSWVFTTVPQGSNAALSDAAAVTPSFTVDKAGMYVVSLIVNDGKVDSTTDTVTISTLNSAPVADAGPDQTPYVNNTVTLNGSGSYDVDGNLLTFKWVYTTKPDGSSATLSNATVVNPTFTVDKAGTYVVSLIVNDGKVDSTTDTVTISTLNSAPVADAGPDQTPYVNNTVTLNGSNSYDVDGNLLTFSWAFTSKPADSTATLSDAVAVTPSFTVDKAGTYVVSLIVKDSTLDSQPDTVTISTLNSAPVANAGADQSVYVGNTVMLDGSVSSDVDGNTLSYNWAFTSKPTGSTATLSNATAVNPTFTVDKAGTYVVSLIVNDGKVDSTADTVTISTINVAPVANASTDQSVHMGNTVTLDGSGSSDADGNALTYSWAFTSKPSGSTAVLSDATAVKPTFTADKAGTYVVSLIVNDGTVNSSPDTVIVTVTDDDDGDDEAPEVIDASVDIKPETINLGSKGKFKAFIELPSPYKEDNIVTSTVVCEGAHAIEGRVDSSSGGRYVATFNTQDLEVSTNSKREEKVFTVTGELMDGTKFEGSDTVKVKGKEKDK